MTKTLSANWHRPTIANTESAIDSRIAELVESFKNGNRKSVILEIGEATLFNSMYMAVAIARALSNSIDSSDGQIFENMLKERAVTRTRAIVIIHRHDLLGNVI